MSTSIEFTLSEPLKYASGGKEVETDLLVLKPPTGKVTAYCCTIESLIQSGIIAMSGSMSSEELAKAQAEATEKKAKADARKAAGEEPEPEDPMDEESFWALVTASNADMNKVILNFRALFKEVVMMGNEKLITEARLDEISHKDTKRLMGKYGANFIMT